MDERSLRGNEFLINRLKLASEDESRVRKEMRNSRKTKLI